MKMHFKKNSGFTLVELIVVIAILAILAAVAIPAYSGYIEKANKAGDEQLLAAVNKAFTSACLERGYDYTKAAASFKVDADGKLEKTNNMYIENFMLSGSDAAAKGNVDSSFADYYAGNEDAQFRNIKNSSVTIRNGVISVSAMVAFGDSYLYADSALVEAWKNGSLGDMSAEELSTLVGDASAMISSDEWADYRTTVVASGAFKEAAESLLGVDYDDYMQAQIEAKAKADYNGDWDQLSDREKNRLIDAADDTYRAQYESNIMALVTTKTADSASKDIIDVLQTSNPKDAIKQNVMSSENATLGVTQSALAYGLYLSYAEANNIDTTGLTAQGALNKLKEEGFQNYLGTKQAQTDLESFVAALEIVGDQNQDAVSNVVTGGFTNSELIGALGQILENNN